MREFIDGNEAVVLGALDAGCDFFAGYPITPASSILVGMLRELPLRRGVAVQAEDEIASIGMCIGAAMTGRKAMTATSGPGISLYSENIGLALMGETPLVIVNVQRQGPATGSATKGADGDIQFMRWVTSGGLPMIVLSPENAAECYTLTIRAFNLAERFRIPVFLASQKEVGLTRELVDLDVVRRSAPAVVPRTVAPVDCVYEPHACALLEEVGPMSPIGGPHLVRYTTSTHDQRAYLAKDPVLIEEMLDHYRRKITDHLEEISHLDVDEQEGADTVIITYGVTARAARDAVASQRAAGRKVSLVVLKTLFPVPEAELAAVLARHERVVVAEMNLGQYVQELRRLTEESKIVSVAKMNTELISPTEILVRGGLS